MSALARLGLRRPASANEIRDAYRKLGAHPFERCQPTRCVSSQPLIAQPSHHLSFRFAAQQRNGIPISTLDATWRRQSSKASRMHTNPPCRMRLVNPLEATPDQHPPHPASTACALRVASAAGSSIRWLSSARTQQWVALTKHTSTSPRLACAVLSSKMPGRVVAAAEGPLSKQLKFPDSTKISSVVCESHAISRVLDPCHS